MEYIRGLENCQTFPLEEIDISVEFGEGAIKKTLVTTFKVIDVHNDYNAIIDQPVHN